MPVGTSDGQYHETEFDYAAAQVQPAKETPITTTPADAGEPSMKLTVRPIEQKPMDEPFVDDKERRTVIDKLLGLTGDRYQTWPEKTARHMLDAFSLPGDVFQGKEEPDSPKTIGRAFELAGALIFGPAPIANKVVDGTLGSMAGVRSTTASRTHLVEAERMFEQGLSPTEIWNTTGWFKGLEGKWRYEIPDQKAKFNQGFADIAAKTMNNPKDLVKTELGTALNHPELFKAYPDLKNIELHVDNSLKVLGHYVDRSGLHKPDIIAFNLQRILTGTENVHPLEIVLHEIQHAIQKREGFNKGSSPASALEKMTSFLSQRAAESKTPVEATKLFDLAERIAANPKTKMGRSIADILYNRTSGELEANLVEQRTKDWVSSKTPIENYMNMPRPIALPSERRGTSSFNYETNY